MALNLLNIDFIHKYTKLRTFCLSVNYDDSIDGGREKSEKKRTRCKYDVLFKKIVIVFLKLLNEYFKFKEYKQISTKTHRNI